MLRDPWCLFPRSLSRRFLSRRASSCRRLPRFQEISVPLLSVLAIGAVIAAGTTALQADSPQFRGPQRDGIYEDQGLMSSWPSGGPKQLWTAEGLGQGYASVSVVGGRIFSTGADAEGMASVVAFDLEGKLLWRKVYGKVHAGGGFPGTRTTPTVDGNSLYIVSSTGKAMALAMQDGSIRWEVDLVERFGAPLPHFGFSESPIVDGPRVILTPGGEDASLVALDKKDGSTLWTSKGLSDAFAYCNPRILEADGLRQVVTLVTKHLVGVDPESGEVLWQEPYEVAYDVHAMSPIFAGRQIYIAHANRQGGALFELASDGLSVRKLWTEKKMDVYHGGVVLIGEHLYGTSSKKTWYALDLKTGRVAAEMRRLGTAAVVAADGRIYGYTEDGKVVLVDPDPQQFAVRGSFEITQGADQHWAHPVIDDGRLYIRHGDVLMAYHLRGAADETPATMETDAKPSP